MKKPGVKPQHKTSTVWSPALAYAVGLLASDGNLSPSGRHINLTSKDKEQIKNFQKCIGRAVTVSLKNSGHTEKKKYYHAQFGDITFYRWLEGIGLSPNKSKTLGTLEIPDEYFFDFLRGVWDGDGCIYAFWDKRWKSSYMYYIAFASSSINFLNWMQRRIIKSANVNGHITTGRRGAYQLKFAKKETKIIFEKMFPTSTVPHLKRKFAKAQKIFRIDEANSKKNSK